MQGEVGVADQAAGPSTNHAPQASASTSRSLVEEYPHNNKVSGLHFS
jgi:hypothetical protein